MSFTSGASVSVFLFFPFYLLFNISLSLTLALPLSLSSSLSLFLARIPILSGISKCDYYSSVLDVPFVPHCSPYYCIPVITSFVFATVRFKKSCFLATCRFYKHRPIHARSLHSLCPLLVPTVVAGLPRPNDGHPGGFRSHCTPNKNPPDDPRGPRGISRHHSVTARER